MFVYAMRGRVWRLLAWFLAAILLSSVLTLAASSVRVVGATEVEATPALVYAEQYGVSVRVAQQRLDRQRRLNRDLGRLVERVGDRHAGAGIDHDVEAMTGWVLITGDAEVHRSVSRFADRRGLEIRYGAAHTYGELMTALGSMDAPDGGFVELDEEANALRMGVPSPAVVPNVSRSADVGNLSGVEVIYETVEGSIENLATMKGGQAIYSPSLPGGRQICTSGFAVQDSRGRKGILTAGHCHNGATQNNRIMRNATESFNHDLDAQWHRVNSGDRVVDDFRCNTGRHRNYCDLSAVEYTPRKGTYVCHYGVRSGISCGTIDSVASDPGNRCQRGWNKDCDKTFLKVKGPWLKACEGDSGGPVYSGRTAYGILKAGTDPGNCTARGKQMWVTRLDEVRDHLGVTVLTR